MTETTRTYVVEQLANLGHRLEYNNGVGGECCRVGNVLVRVNEMGQVIFGCPDAYTFYMLHHVFPYIEARLDYERLNILAITPELAINMVKYLDGLLTPRAVESVLINTDRFGSVILRPTGNPYEYVMLVNQGTGYEELTTAILRGSSAWTPLSRIVSPTYDPRHPGLLTCSCTEPVEIPDPLGPTIRSGLFVVLQDQTTCYAFFAATPPQLIREY